MRRNFSLVARYWLKFTHCSLLFVKSLVTCCKIRSLLVAEVARCKKSLATRRRSCSLQKITCYSLQNLLVTRCRSCSLSKITRYSLQNSLVTRCRSCSLQKMTRCSLQKCARYSSQKLCVPKKSLVSRCEIPSALIEKNHFSLKQLRAGVIVCLKSTKSDESFSFFNVNYFLGGKSTNG